MIQHWHVALTAGALGATLLVAPAVGQEFYAGKTIDLIVGNSPGGGFDIYARALARHIGRHIPGKPNIVVKNMPGAGGARAGYHISNVAPKDGLTIGAVMPGTIVGPLLDEKPDTSFDPTKVTYLGTANAGTYVCVTLDRSKVKTFDQALREKVIMGGITAGNSTDDVAYLVKHLTGAQFNIVSGYKGTADMMLAIERGEVDGVCGWNWSSAKSQRPAWISERKLNYLAQIGMRPNPELTALGAPEIWPYFKSAEDKKVAEVVISQQIFERPYFMAAGAPSALVATLRGAFDATMKDPQFVADARKVKIDVEPRPGAEVQELVQKLYSTPKPILERAKRAIRS